MWNYIMSTIDKIIRLMSNNFESFLCEHFYFKVSMDQLSIYGYFW